MTRKKRLPTGMTLRGNVYYARFRAGGRVVRKRLSSNFGAASEMLNDLRARADKADFGLLDNDFSIVELRKDYLAYCRQTLAPTTVRRYEIALTNVFERIMVRKVSQLSVRLITTYRQDRRAEDGTRLSNGLRAKASPRTVNAEVNALSTMLNFGAAHHMIGSNPIAKVKPLPEDDKRKVRRSLSNEEVIAIFEHSPPYMKPILRMFMCTGIRLNELVNLRFSDIDFDRRTATVRDATAKRRKGREIPLDDEMLDTIRHMETEAQFRKPGKGTTPKMTGAMVSNFSKDHVFVTTANTPVKNNLLAKFYRICKRAGIEGDHRNGSVDLHALRVSFTTLSIENGANPKDVQAILGHSTLSMTMNVYSKATEWGKRSVVNALPFARASAPEGIIPMQNGPRMRPSTKSDSQVSAS